MRLFSCHRVMVLTITMTLVMTMASTPCIYAFLLRSSPSPSVDGLSSSNKEKVLPHQGLHAVRYSDKEGDQQETLPDFSTPQRCDRRRNASNSNCHSSSVVKTLVRGVAGILLMAQIMTASVFPTHATAPALEAASQPPLSQQQQSTVYGQPYWTIMNEGQDDGRIAANTALMDYAVGTINSMFYDHSGGAFFQPRDFYATWKAWIKQPDNQESLASRDGVVNGLQWLTAQLNDPFSRYLTREQLREELSRSNFGFLGSGAIVEVPAGPTFFGSLRTPVMSEVPPTLIPKRGGIIVGGDRKQLLSAKFVQKLPVLTAISPDSPAERAGLTVGDRIVAVQQDSFLGLSSSQAVKDKLTGRYQADNYAGTTELTVAKPVYAMAPIIDAEDVREVIVGYRSQRLRLTTASVSPPVPSLLAETTSSTSTAVSVMKLAVAGGDSLVHYQLLAAEPGQPSSLFLGDIGNDKGETQHRETVAYIRLTRFSKATTDAFVKTIERLESDNSDHGRSSPNSYIIDLRNNYGGVIQEAMLTASSLLRDPHAVLCYTMNSRGGFTPHDVLEFVADYDRYPGYLLSREDKMTTVRQLHRNLGPTSGLVQPQQAILASPPSSFASIREQKVTRGIHSVSTTTAAATGTLGYNHDYTTYSGLTMSQYHHHRAAQKKIVILVNEGTASAAEVFASALHDNGRTVALVGTRTYGKGLIQHTFPLPDGGGLRLTVAEYLTPGLRHVTNVGGAQYNQVTGDWVGGGINPDLYCESKQGIPSNIGADLCVGVALDALQEEASSSALDASSRALLQHW